MPKRVLISKRLAKQNVPSLTVGSLTVTGSANLGLFADLGLGIGGSTRLIPEKRSFSLSQGRHQTCEFDGQWMRAAPDVHLSAFDESGALLGTATAGITFGFCLNISAILNVDPMSRVEITSGPSSTFRIPRISFDLGDVDSDDDGVSG